MPGPDPPQARLRLTVLRLLVRRRRESLADGTSPHQADDRQSRAAIVQSAGALAERGKLNVRHEG